MAAALISEPGGDNRPPIAKIRWQCRRGMLELDVLLERFVTAHYEQLEPEPLNCFLTLLDCEDDQLWDWLSGRANPGDARLADICAQIRRCR